MRPHLVLLVLAALVALPQGGAVGPPWACEDPLRPEPVKCSAVDFRRVADPLDLFAAAPVGVQLVANDAGTWRAAYALDPPAMSTLREFGLLFWTGEHARVPDVCVDRVVYDPLYDAYVVWYDEYETPMEAVGSASAGYIVSRSAPTPARVVFIEVETLVSSGAAALLGDAVDDDAACAGR